MIYLLTCLGTCVSSTQSLTAHFINMPLVSVNSIPWSPEIAKGVPTKGFNLTKKDPSVPWTSESKVVTHPHVSNESSSFSRSRITWI